MSTADDKKVSPETASAAHAPGSVPPTADLEAAEKKEIDDTEALLSGFDRSPRRPKRVEKRDSGRDFVAHFSGKADVQPPPPPETKERDPARNAPTVVVPREAPQRTWVTWALVVAAMLLVGWFAATGLIRALAKGDTPTEAPTVATTTVTLAPASAPARVDPIPLPEPADVTPAVDPAPSATMPVTPPTAAKVEPTAAKVEPTAAPRPDREPRAVTPPPTTTAPEPRPPAPPPPAASPARSNGYIPEL